MKVRVKPGHTVNDGAGLYGEGEVLDLPAIRARSLIADGRVVEVKPDK